MPGTPFPRPNQSIAGDEREDTDPTNHHNVHIFDAKRLKVAGLHQRGSTSVATLIRWLDYVLSVEEPWTLSTTGGTFTFFAREDTMILLPGEYKIVSTRDHRALSVSFQPDLHPVPRIMRRLRPDKDEKDFLSRHNGCTFPRADTVDEEFETAVLRRDGRRSILPLSIKRSSNRNSEVEVTRLFPRGALEMWLTSDLASHTGCRFETEADLTRTLDQPWNGITLDVDQCNLFEFYDLAIDVDDDYRMVQLSQSAKYYDSRLKWTPREDLPAAERPSDALLRAHFRQALLRYVIGRPYSFDLVNAFSRPDTNAFGVELCDTRWVSGEGKLLLEHYLMQELFSWLPAVAESAGRGQSDCTSRTVPWEDEALKRKRSDSASASDGSASPRIKKEIWFDTFEDPPPPPVQYAENNELDPFSDVELDDDLDLESSSGDSNGSGISSPKSPNHDVFDHYLDDLRDAMGDHGSIVVARAKAGASLDVMVTVTSSEAKDITESSITDEIHDRYGLPLADC